MEESSLPKVRPRNLIHRELRSSDLFLKFDSSQVSVNSARSGVLVNGRWSPVRPARSSCLGGPFHNSPDATTLVSSTSRIRRGAGHAFQRASLRAP